MRARHAARVAAAGFAAAAAALLLLPPATATADSAVTSGWWNEMSAQGQAAPSPTTAAGDLHIAAAPQQTLAFAAVRFQVSGSVQSATLQLPIASTVNAGSLVACPTTTASWQGGDDQPASAAPGYDCTAAAYTGLVSADGKTLTFLLDSRAERVPGVLSVAVLPVQTQQVPEAGEPAPVDTTEPFSVDLSAPTAADLVVTSATPIATGGSTSPFSGNDAGPAGMPAAPPAAPAGNGGLTLPAPTTGVGALPGSPPDVALPPATGTPAATGGQAPAVAAPAAAVGSTSSTGRNAALALLIAFALVALGTSSPRPARMPRLLAGPHAGAAPPVPVPVAATGSMRGVGRYARSRTEPPRPLL